MKQIKTLFVAVILLITMSLVACGGSAEPDANESGDPVGTAVALTVAAINAVNTLPPTPEVTLVGEPDATAVSDLPTSTTPPDLPSATPILPTDVPPTAALPTATILPSPTPTATRQPPNLDNVAVGGENFPADHVFGEVIVDPTFLIRMAVRDSNFFPVEGDNDGAGIDHVEFFIADSEGFSVYEHRENIAGYCIFAGGEPDCNPWPTNGSGQYTWGQDGPVVVSGDYQVNINVFSKDPDADLDFGGIWNWNFSITVTVP